MRPFTFLLVGGLALFLLPVCPAAEERKPDPAQFFIAPNEAATLHLEAPPGTTTPAAFVVRDYEGKQVASGNARCEKEAWALEVRLPIGYYEVTLADPPQVFGLAVLPAATEEPDPFFCLDAGLSWLAPPAWQEGYVRILQRSGIALVRERFNWATMHSSSDSPWKWNADHPYEATRQLYLAARIPIMELASGAPVWTKSRPELIYPDLLVPVADDWKQIAQKWSSGWGAVEAWNEPDLNKGHLPADRYVPWAKTLRFALRGGGTTVPMGGGVFANWNPAFMDASARNGLLDESDFISFHYYGAPSGMAQEVGQYRSWLKEFGHTGMPLWLSECGAPWEGNPAGTATPEQARLSARRFAGNATEAKACGVARFFAFVLVRYAEQGARNLGMLDARGAPTRGMSAYLTAVRLLGHKDYVGDLSLDGSTVTRARVFANATGEAVVVLAADKSEGSSKVTLPFTPDQVLGVDGRVLAGSTPNDAPLSDGVTYLITTLRAVGDRLSVDTPVMPLARMAREKTSGPAPLSPIVLMPTINDPTVTAETRGYLIAEGTPQIHLTVQVANLDDHDHDVAVSLHGGKTDSPVLGTMTLTVPARQTASTTLPVNLDKLSPEPGGNDLVRIEAQSPGVARIAAASLSLIPSLGLETQLKRFAYQYAVPIGEEARWKINSNGLMQFVHGPEAQWGFTAKFSARNGWAFPRYTVPQEADLKRVEGVLIRARCDAPAIVRFMAGSVGSSHATPFPIIPSDGAWHVAYVPLANFLPAGESQAAEQLLKTVSIGCNDASGERHLEVSDFYLLGQ